ncbi:hypothetical protein E2P81_ATG05573 [Venturia nashicola]|nr:hypothetical protein E2P81_ATG05573 [Venturia nashicola]
MKWAAGKMFLLMPSGTYGHLSELNRQHTLLPVLLKQGSHSYRYATFRGLIGPCTCSYICTCRQPLRLETAYNSLRKSNNDGARLNTQPLFCRAIHLLIVGVSSGRQGPLQHFALIAARILRPFNHSSDLYVLGYHFTDSSIHASRLKKPVLTHSTWPTNLPRINSPQGRENLAVVHAGHADGPKAVQR